MNISQIQEHGNRAVQFIECAVSELKTINNLSLAEHLNDLGTMLAKHVEDLPYTMEEEHILKQYEEQEIYNEFG
jgi:hypothetical protein